MPPHSDLRDLDGREAVITASHVRKDYGAFTAVRDATFAVARGEIFGLLGPNGAGKTTTVECLQGLREASGGTHRRARARPGAPVARAAPPRGQPAPGSRPARPHPRLGGARALRLADPGGRDWRDVMAEWGLAEKSKASFHALSGGQRQRLFVALAVVNGPEVVFLDEMTTGLDPAARRIAWDLIREIRERGSTVVLVTHFMEEAERLCDRIAVMDQGPRRRPRQPTGLIASYAPACASSLTRRPTSASSPACASSRPCAARGRA